MRTSRERAAEYRAIGACTICGEDLLGVEKAKGRRRCERCRKTRNRNYSKYRVKRRATCRANGICLRCLRKPSERGYAKCKPCLEYCRERSKISNPQRKWANKQRAIVARLELDYPRIAARIRRELGMERRAS